jgi:hypothetical protein
MEGGTETTDEAQHGGTRPGAGRPRGSLNRRTSALRDAIEAEGVDPAVALVRIGKAAEARAEYALAADCYGKVLPFLHAKVRTSADAHPEEALEFARAMLSAKIEAAATTISQPGLAERLQRAHARVQIMVDTGVVRAPDDVMVDVTPDTPTAAPQAPAAPPSPAAGPAPATDAPNAYRPVLPRPVTPAPAPAVSADWAAPVAPWPNRNEGHAKVDYDPTGGAYEHP